MRRSDRDASEIAITDLPHSDEAEQAVLGSMLLEPVAAIPVARDLLDRTDFYREPHAQAFAALLTMHSEGSPIDLTTLAMRLQETGQLDGVGGINYLANLLEATSTAATIERQIVVVKQRALRRRLIEQARDLAEKAAASNGSPDTILGLQDSLTLTFAELAEGGYRAQGQTVEYQTCSTAEPDPINWIVAPILPMGALALVSGDAGAGKSYLLLDLLQSVASGEWWLDRFRTCGGPCLLFDEENGATLNHLRVWRLGVGRQSLPTVLPIRFRIRTGLKVNRRQGLAALRCELRETAPAIVVFDSFRAHFDGDENDSGEVRRCLDTLRGLAGEYSCAIVLVHHTRKMTALFNNAAQAPRGSSDLRAAVDTHLHVRLVERTPDALRISVEHEKSRWGGGAGIFMVRLSFEGEQGAATLSYEGHEGVDEDRAGQEGALVAVQQWIGESATPVSRQALIARATEAGMATRTVERAVALLRQEGIIVRELDGHKTYYALAPDADA